MERYQMHFLLNGYLSQPNAKYILKENGFVREKRLYF